MALLLPTSKSAAITRQLIEAKLLEMDREPRNAQVLLQDSGENTVISSIDEGGIICTYKPCKYEPYEHGLHVGQPPDITLTRDEPSGVRSALCDMGDDLVEVKMALEAKGQELQTKLERLRQQVEEALDAERRNFQQKDAELIEVRSTLERKAKGEKGSREKCGMQLLHED